MSSSRLSMSKAADALELTACQLRPVNEHLVHSPVLKTVGKVEINAIVEATIIQKLLEGQEWMICDNVPALIAGTIIELFCCEPGPRLVIHPVFVIGAVYANYPDQF